LVAEVASSSVHKDRRIKGELSARAGIPEYWLINLQNDVVEVHTQPSASGYTSIAQARSGDSLNPHAFADLAISVSALLRLG
jgi:Uma2 family endonuclease